MNPTLLLTSSVIGAVVAALLNGYWNRRAAKKAPKTEMRAEAYQDLVVFMLRDRSLPASTSTSDHGQGHSGTLAEITARLVLFGESEVVSATSTYLGAHGDLTDDRAVADFVPVVCAMRKSLLTGHGPDVATSIRALLRRTLNASHVSA